MPQNSENKFKLSDISLLTLVFCITLLSYGCSDTSIEKTLSLHEIEIDPDHIGSQGSLMMSFRVRKTTDQGEEVIFYYLDSSGNLQEWDLTGLPGPAREVASFKKTEVLDVRVKALPKGEYRIAMSYQLEPEGEIIYTGKAIAYTKE